MSEQIDPNERFQASRPHLHAVAYRMLGSLAEADDAVQETWLRLERAGADGVDNLAGWLTTVTARVCLDMLRARRVRSERWYVPDPIVSRQDDAHPEHQRMLADSVGLALLVVLETLSPAERLAFVLHDLFAMPFDAIAPLVERTPEAARQLASRARRRVRAVPVPDGDRSRQRAVVDAFLAASRDGDFAALLAVLDPDVVLRADRGPDAPAELSRTLHGADAVSRGTVAGTRHAGPGRRDVRATVNGGPGLVVFVDGTAYAVLAFTLVGDRIVEIDILADPVRLARLGLVPGDFA